MDNISNNKVIWTRPTDPTPLEIMELAKDYLKSCQFQYLNFIADYYNTQNTKIMHTVQDRRNRNKMPNWCIPTAYSFTLVDSMAGYLFANVVYSDDTAKEEVKDENGDIYPQEDSEFSMVLNETFKEQNIDAIDIRTGIYALAYNKGCEIVYTTLDDDGFPEARTVSVDPRQMLFIYNNDIEPKLLYAIRVISIDETVGRDKYDLMIDFISKSMWASYWSDGKEKIIENPNFITQPLYWSQCPAIEYNTEILNGNTAFHQVLPLIDALDAVITGNSNELDKLADALLVISDTLTPEKKKVLNELKLFEGMGKEDRVEYVQRQIDPEFRRFLVDVLTREIHKQAHVIDFYSPDQGGTGDASGKALKTRMVDMNMFCDRIEKAVKLGWQKRIALYKEFYRKAKSLNFEGQNVKPVFNRTPIVGAEDIAMQLTNVTFLSDETKQELCGVDPRIEKERMEKQKSEAGEDVTGMFTPQKEPIDASAPMSEPMPMDANELD